MKNMKSIAIFLVLVTSILPVGYLPQTSDSNIPPNLIIDCYGDSMTAGIGQGPLYTYPYWLQDLLPNTTVNNYGVGGWSIITIVDAINATEGHIIVLMGGTCDVYGQPPTLLAVIQECYGIAINKCRNAGATLVGVAIPASPGLNSTLVYQANAIIRNVCAEAGIVVISTEGMEPGFFQGDGIHLDISGAQFIAQRIAMVIT